MEHSSALKVPGKVAQYARSSLLTLTLVLSVGLGFGSASVSSAVAATPLPGCSASEMYIVAHEDDSLLFQSPALLQDIQSGHCVRSVFLTAGDAGEGQSYWGAREQGAEAAYAQMAGVSDAWSESTIVANGHPIVLETLSGAPAISLVFMRLPDGFPSGEGSPLFSGQSLERLWGSGNPSGSLEPPISSITAVDGSTSYGYQNLIDTLGSLIASFEPQQVATQNFDGVFHGPNHDDHVATAYFTQEAQKSYVASHQLIGYEDYEASERPANLSGSLLAQKSAAFYVYGEHDSHACGSSDGCGETAYANWLTRQYVAAIETTGLVAVAGYSQTVAGGETVNLDGSASSAESELPLTYKWTQTAGPPVTLSSTTAAKPTFTAPTGPATLTFSLVVSNGSKSSTPASVEVKVAAPSTPSSTNVAPLATATASSQASGQGAKEAIDGILSGYPKDSTAEWATVSGKVNSTLTLKWTSSYTLDHVVLYDRPNSDDQITAGKLTFADGQSVSFGSLPNGGTPGLTVSFPAHATTSLTMTVTGVSATTKNVGLSEIEAFGVAGEAPATLAPSITSASSTSFTSGTQKSFTVIAAGNPAPALTETGTLPSGLSFQDNGNGTAGLSGTAKAVGTPGSSQSYPLTFTATNSAGTATQQFTLTVVNGETPPVETPPTANAGSAQSVASAASVTLDGSASSDPNKLPLTYKWTQTAGPPVTLSSTTAAKPTFTAPTGPATLTFSLVVSNGSKSSTPASVEVKVAAPSTPSSTNVAPLATATASSQASGQGAKEAIDGILSGYPKDSTAEWATVSGKVNSTLTLKWTSSYTLDHVVLYDRPNSDDQITAGKLTFADGQSVSFGSLPNGGTPGLTVSFPAHATTSLTMTVTGVSATTKNVGLSEIEAFGVGG
jgi:LmbE family N-acetylglucosaminyl deacetylase